MPRRNHQRVSLAGCLANRPKARHQVSWLQAAVLQLAVRLPRLPPTSLVPHTWNGRLSELLDWERCFWAASSCDRYGHRLNLQLVCAPFLGDSRGLGPQERCLFRDPKTTLHEREMVHLVLRSEPGGYLFST